MTEAEIPSRSEIDPKDTWDLSKLFPNDEAWEEAFAMYGEMIARVPAFKGTLGKSAESLANFLDYMRDLNIFGEYIGNYANLSQMTNMADSSKTAMAGRILMAYAKLKASVAWEDPEIMAIPDDKMKSFLENPALKEYRVLLSRILRFKPHTLSEKEERQASIHMEGEAVCVQAFSILTNADMDFGVVETPEGKRPLTQSTWMNFMQHPNRELRQRVYKQFYHQFNTHRNTLAMLYEGQVKFDVIHARIFGYPSARANALFSDNVDEKVYDNLIETIGNNLGPLHRYYDIRKRALKLSELKPYDVYVPLANRPEEKIPWNEAVDLVSRALSPLGSEYTETLKNGLLGRWADRYENKGKRSGAFAMGGYTGDPYIFMNYQEDSIRDTFTLAHEGGHAMHFWYSVRNNTFSDYEPSIFEAEVASTFNEELLYRFLTELAEADGKNSKERRLFIVNKRIDDIIATLYRQTMFAEFEHWAHRLLEEDNPLTVDMLRDLYRQLLEKYFGSEMILEKESDLECFRIPHFYTYFYVYKYATGLSAALALADRVLGGGEKERNDYFNFLKSGGSRFPIDSLKAAGVDMSSPAPVKAATAVFSRLVDELESLL